MTAVTWGIPGKTFLIYVLLLALAPVLSSCGWVDRKMQVWFGDSFIEPQDDPVVAVFDDFNPALHIKESWSNSIGTVDGEFFKSIPGVEGNALFVSSEDEVTAYEALSGKPLWSTALPSAVSFGVGIADSQVLVGTANGRVISLDAHDGEKLWDVRVSDQRITAVSSGHKGYIAARAEEGTIVLLESDDGNEQWRVAVDLPIVTLSGMSVPLFFANTVVVGLDDGRVVGLYLTDGSLAFEFQVGKGARQTNMSEFADVDGPMVIRDGIAYASSALGRTVAFDLARQSLVWVYADGSHHGVALGDEILYMVGRNGQLRALNSVSGVELWATELFSRRKLTTPLAIYPFVVIGDDLGYLYWFSEKSGTVLARERVTRHPLQVLLGLADEVHVSSLGENGNLAMSYAKKLKAKQ